MKSKDRQRAVELRQSGLSYKEIQRELNVSSSTLSLWLRNVLLPPDILHIIKGKHVRGRLKGSSRRKQKRMEQISTLQAASREDIGLVNKRDLFIAGCMLYWAEGAKQKEYNVSQGVCFANSDAQMVKLFLRWLDTICAVNRDLITFELYIHISANADDAVAYWALTLGISPELLHVYYKRNRPSVFRYNTQNRYHGLVRVKVKKSTQLNRRIAGWISAIAGNWGVV